MKPSDLQRLTHTFGLDQSEAKELLMKCDLPYDGYIRVSRVGARSESDGFISPTTQRQAIEAWAKKNGHEVVFQEPELNVSGGTMDRPVFNHILERIAAGESGGIVVYKIDRFARSVQGALNALADIKDAKAGVASCTESFSYTTPEERLSLHMQLSLAQFTRDSITEGWKVSTTSAIERGIHIANETPFGYDLGPDRVLVPNAYFAPIVAEVFKRRANGHGWHRLRTYLDDVAPLYRVDGAGELWQRPLTGDGKPIADEDLTPEPKRPKYRAFAPDALTADQQALSQRVRWGHSRVQRLTSKRVYLGEAHYGDLCNPEAHEPLVSKSLFRRANDSRGEALRRDPDKTPNLLQTLARCASCRYTLKEGRGANRGDGRKVRTYRCNTRAVAGTCPNCQSIVAATLENYVVEHYKANLRHVRGQAVPLSDAYSRAQEQLAEAEAELDAFLADVAGAGALRRVSRYEQALTARTAAVEQARARVTDVEATLDSAGVDAATWSFDIDEWWESAAQETRQRALRAAIDVVFLRGPGRGPVQERVRILWRGQGPDDLPRRGRENGGIRPYQWAAATGAAAADEAVPAAA